MYLISGSAVSGTAVLSFVGTQKDLDPKLLFYTTKIDC